MLRISQNCVNLYKDLVNKSNLVNIPCNTSQIYILDGDRTAEICNVDVNKFDIVYVYFCFCDADNPALTSEEHLLIFTSPTYYSLGVTSNFGKPVIYGNIVKYYIKSTWYINGIIAMGSWTRSGFCITRILGKPHIIEKKLLNKNIYLFYNISNIKEVNILC